MNVETSEDNWEAVRNVYMTVVFKQKLTMDESNPFSKRILLMPKNIEITNIKVMKDQEEMTMEQMMI